MSLDSRLRGNDGKGRGNDGEGRVSGDMRDGDDRGRREDDRPRIRRCITLKARANL